MRKKVKRISGAEKAPSCVCAEVGLNGDWHCDGPIIATFENRAGKKGACQNHIGNYRSWFRQWRFRLLEKTS